MITMKVPSRTFWCFVHVVAYEKRYSLKIGVNRRSARPQNECVATGAYELIEIRD